MRQREGSCRAGNSRSLSLPLICLTLGSPEPAENKQSLSTTPTLPAGRPELSPCQGRSWAPLLTPHQAPSRAGLPCRHPVCFRPLFGTFLFSWLLSTPFQPRAPSRYSRPSPLTPGEDLRPKPNPREQGLGAKRNRNPANKTPSARAGREEGVETVTDPHGFCAGAQGRVTRGPGITSLGRRSPRSAEMPGGWLSCSGATKQERRKASTTSRQLPRARALSLLQARASLRAGRVNP